MDKLSKIVITHPEMGVYLGCCMGLGFWSKLDAAGQDSAVTFDSKAQASEHICSWDENNDPDAYGFVVVTASEDTYATVADLKRAGLSSLLGDMKEPPSRPAINNEPSGPGF